MIRGRWISQPVTPDLERSCAGTGDPIRSTDCKRGKEGKVGETPSLALKCADKRGTSVFYIATVGEPLILRITGSSSSGPFDMKLVDHDTGIQLDAPQGNVIDLRG